jgi:hypothetical protein
MWSDEVRVETRAGLDDPAALPGRRVDFAGRRSTRT